MNDIIENIKHIRKQKQLTQKDVAEKLGITPAGYQKIEVGSIELTYNKLKQIAGIFQMSEVEIIEYPNVVGAGQDRERVKELEGMYLEKLEKAEKMQTVNIQLVLAFYDLRDFFIKSQNEGKDINELYSITLSILNKYIELFKMFLGVEETKE